jgi:hypothetical protein
VVAQERDADADEIAAGKLDPLGLLREDNERR